MTILEYRNTPLKPNSPSPAQLLFGRRLEGLMPCLNKKLTPKIISFEKQLKANQETQKRYYDRQAKDLPPMKKGNRVILQTEKRGWEPGVVIENVTRPRSYQVQLDNGSLLERNRRFLRRDSSKDKTPSPESLQNKRALQRDNVIDESVAPDQVQDMLSTEDPLRRSSRATKPPLRLQLNWKERCYDVGNIRLASVPTGCRRARNASGQLMARDGTNDTITAL